MIWTVGLYARPGYTSEPLSVRTLKYIKKGSLVYSRYLCTPFFLLFYTQFSLRYILLKYVSKFPALCMYKYQIYGI